MILEKFKKHLTDIIYPDEPKSWNISGILTKKSNEHLKYDVRDMSIIDNSIAKKISTATQADKIVFETKNYWLIFDNEELKNYVINNKLNLVYLNDIIKKLNTWKIKKDE